MQIKITYIGIQNKIDLLVDNQQKIINTLNILKESEEFMFIEDISQIHYVKSRRKNKQISVFCSYKEADIYSGDVLTIESTVI